MAIQFTHFATPGLQIALPTSDLPSYAQSGTVTLNNKTTYPAAYGQVTSVAVTKTSGTAQLVVYSDHSKATALQSRLVEFNYSIDDGNPIQQAYEHFKTLPEFADATDC